MNNVRSMSPRSTDHLERVRPLVMAWLILAAALLMAYWIAWFADRSLIASNHTAGYIAFEQAFPLADAWLLVAILIAAVKLLRHQPSALLWLAIVGGAGVYLCTLDVLYDLQHDIYLDGHGGAIELTINVLTGVSSIGVMVFGWHFRHQLFEGSS